MIQNMSKCAVIAEAGVNHNGRIEQALQLVDVAAEAGADAVKFQTFRARELVTQTAEKAAYQQRKTGSAESQYAMLRRLELTPDAHVRLLDHCRSCDITFLSTPFDCESAVFLVDTCGVDRFKIPSGEITNGPFLLALARQNLPMIVSTGMATLGEIERALSVLAYGMLNPEPSTAAPSPEAFQEAFASADGQRVIGERVTLLHCTSEYPAPVDDVNLRAMDTLRDAFHLPVGLSDHSEGIAIPIAAAARGATLVEKHFTLDRTLPGPDHAASLEPDELAAMIEGIRQVEAALGSGRKLPATSEMKNRAVARKSLVARRPIAAGEPFTADMLTAKRPGTGLSPMNYWRLLGQPAPRPYEADEVIEAGGSTGSAHHSDNPDPF